MSDPSASHAMNRAIEHARALLFPARMEKWLALGFIVFLAGLSESGIYNFRTPLPGGSGSGGSGKSSTPDKIFDDFRREALSWMTEHMALLIAAVGAVIVCGLALALFLTWVSSRGKLMLVESVIHDRYQVKEPWARLREPAWQVFKFRLLLVALVVLAVVLAFGVAFGVGGATAVEELQTGNFGTRTLAAALTMVGVSFAAIVPIGVISALFDDFVIPVFYLRGGTLGSAWQVLRSELAPGNVGAVVIFYLLKFVLGIGFALIATLSACLTCCVAALPYISSVALLPAHVFFRSYSLHFLEQLGQPVFPERQPPAPAYPHYPQRFGS